MQTKDIVKIRQQLIQWYMKNHRRLPWRDTADPYHIWVSEVMLQQTQIKTVVPYYRKFLLQFPDLKRLADADLQDVLKVWEGLGYYVRARNLHRAAQVVVAECQGRIPENRTDFKKLPGVGEYIASAVQSIAFHRPHAVVDGNVKRVLARLLKMDAPVNQSGSYKIFAKVAGELLDTGNPGTFNQAVMELGATVCKPQNPACSCCPLRSFCLAHECQDIPQYPKRIRRKPTPEYHIAVGVVYENDRVLIARRKPEGLLGGLWEFPGGKVKPHEAAEAACVREIREELNLVVAVDSRLTRVKHAYTHFKIVMDVFICKYVSGEVSLKGPVDYRWTTLADLEKYPFPKANNKFIPLLA